MNPQAEDVEAGQARGKGCALAAGLVLIIIILTTAVLLAWPYVSGSARHPTRSSAIQSSETPLLPPPEHSDENAR